MRGTLFLRTAPAVFTAAILVGSALLFWMELLFAKMILPVLGGSPAVWSTCLVFFQGTLLAGYAYAHASLRWLSPRKQAVLHLALLFAAALLLPVAVPHGWAPPASSNPVLSVLLLLLVAIGLPVFAISATAPIIQAWFARARHALSADPYFLYAASNMGSIAALVVFPLFIEPRFLLAAQSRAWAAVYLVWSGGLMVVCAAFLRRSTCVPDDPGAGLSPPPGGRPVAVGSERPAIALRVRWLLLSFTPASLLMGATTHITTDLAPLPLLWVLPLGLYLLSFIPAFARRPFPPHRFTVAVFPFLVLILVPVSFLLPFGPLSILPHLLFLFVASLYCHGELARSRPPADFLTGFYLWIAAGGLLGGVFNALVAPLLFTTVVEYPLVIVLALGIPPAREGVGAKIAGSRFSPGLLLLPGAVLAAMFLLAQRSQYPWAHQGPFQVVLLSLALLSCLVFHKQALRFGLAVGAVLLSAHYAGPQGIPELYRERNFFGTLSVSTVAKGTIHILRHGTTNHGAQDFTQENRRKPQTYYTVEGPLGDYLWAFGDALAGKRIAVVGLGAGSVAAYGQRGQEITFYEIDPAVERIARDGRYFTFLADSEAKITVVIGDARLKLAEAPDRTYALIVLDAFSSDAIPVHLLTREALALYQRKLEEGGALLVHFTNRNLLLEPLLAGLAQDARSVCLVRHDRTSPSAEGVRFKAPSDWAAIVRRPEDLGYLPVYPGWDMADTGRTVLWTDEYSSILGLIQPIQTLFQETGLGGAQGWRPEGGL